MNVTIAVHMIRFGPWTNSLEIWRERFQMASPFEHVIIPHFLHEEDAKRLLEAFPSVDETWHRYENPIENKYSLNRFHGNTVIEAVFHHLQTDSTVNVFKTLTGIHDLEADPHLHGAGLHAYPRGGKLDIHLDYSIHPITGQERRINLLLYLNTDWDTTYGGQLQLWDEGMESCTQTISPTFNTAVIFRTSDLSYHGLPQPLACPDGMYRRSLAIYYVSPPRPSATKRYKAEFVPLPHQPVNDSLRRLYEIRKHRLITPQDLVMWPDWKTAGHGFW